VSDTQASLVKPVNTVSALTSSAEHPIRHHIIIWLPSTLASPNRQSHRPLRYATESTSRIFMATARGCINSSLEPGKNKANPDLKYQVRLKQKNARSAIISRCDIPEHLTGKKVPKQALKYLFISWQQTIAHKRYR